MFHAAVIVFLVLLATGAAILHLQRQEESPILKALLVILAAFSLWFYSNYGAYHWVVKTDPAFVEATGNSHKRTLYHWHEHYHYYLGSKYYKELQYYGLYEAVALADAESSNPRITRPRMRDLSNPTQSISIEEAIERARTKHRPRFSDARWEEFTRDLAYMKTIAGRDWFNTGVFDAGFNPPPTWNVIGHTISNLIPISDPWMTYPPTWDQAELLSLLDVLLLAIGCIFLYRAFGTVGLALFIIAFGTSFVSSIGWTGGAYLRHLWLFGLICGISSLKMERYFLSGVFLGFAMLMRVFPAVFVAGAGLMLLYRFIREPQGGKRPLIHYILGVGSVSITLIGLSLMMFGTEYWLQFLENISIHKDLFFVWHIGYRRIAVWADWVPNQSFWWAEGLASFAVWNARLVESWESQQWIQIPFTVSLVAAAAWAMRRLRLEEGTLLFGGLTLFLFAIPANYYYAYAALIPVVLMQYTRDWRDSALLISFLALWSILHAIPNWGGDDLTQNYRICIAFFFFFLIWLGLRLYHRDTALARYMHKTLEQ